MFEPGQKLFIQKGNMLFQKTVDLMCVCVCLGLVDLVAFLRIFAGLKLIFNVIERVLICFCNL